jgi:hypothetical protein
VPGPPGRGVNRRRVRGRAQGRPAAADVLGTDETPASLATAEGCGSPHVYTVRTMRAYTSGGPDLIWFGAAGNRTKPTITGLGILDGYRGVMVRDDYGGYLSYDAGLAGVQQCLAHLYRYLDDAYAIDPVSQVWTRQAGDALSARPPPPSGPHTPATAVIGRYARRYTRAEGRHVRRAGRTPRSRGQARLAWPRCHHRAALRGPGCPRRGH